MAASTPFLGQVQAFAFDFAPKDWAQCNGQQMQVNTNTALFALLGIRYGGDGKTVFNLPDLRGRAPRGYGQGPNLSPCTMGLKAGAETITLTVSNLPVHTHAFYTAPPTGTMASSAPATSPVPTPATPCLAALNDTNLGAVNNFYGPSAPNIVLNTGTGTTPALGNTGGGMPVNIMQPFQVVNFCISLKGISPPRQ